MKIFSINLNFSKKFHHIKSKFHFESNFKKQAASISENEELTKKIAINGTTINYVQMGNGENPTLVFIHGFGGDLNNWMFNQEELSKSFNTFAGPPGLSFANNNPENPFKLSLFNISE